MKFSYNWLQSFFKKKLPTPEKLSEILTMRSFEVKEVKKTQDDHVLDIDVLPNRMPDCSGHVGVAREISAILNTRFKNPIPKLKGENNEKIEKFLKIEIKNKNLCPRYYAKVITNIKISPSPKWLKHRLTVCGIEPINNIVDSTNYIMLETGQPLHAFDLNKISGDKIVVRRAKYGEKITTLDGNNYTLIRDDLIIADSKKPIAIAGIKGGTEASVVRSTQNIVLEAANFNRPNIYRTSKRLKIQSDAALRFSSGIDPNLVKESIVRVCHLIQEITKGNILKRGIDIYPEKVLPKRIKLNLDYVGDLLGTEISKRKIIKILQDLGFSISDRSPSRSQFLIVKVPTFRQDVFIREDLIEEIGRVFSYQKIQAMMPMLPVMVPDKNIEGLWEKKIKHTLKGLGFIETYNYSFISEKDKLFLKKVDRGPSLIEIENPTSSNTRYLRPSLLLNLFKVVKDNQARLKKVDIFEIGKVFYWKKFKKGIQKHQEKKMLGGLALGEGRFFELKGKLETFLENMGIVDVLFGSCQSNYRTLIHNCWVIPNTAEIKVGHKKIGYIGQASRRALSFFQIKDPVFIFEIDFEKILELISEEHEYELPSRYPETTRDLAILVPVKTLASEVIQKIQLGGTNLIREIEVFDIFEGPPLPAGKKNLAFHIIYQAKDRTLTSAEIDKLQKKITKTLERNFSWEVRKK